jgi:hypothetical protein
VTVFCPTLSEVVLNEAVPPLTATLDWSTVPAQVAPLTKFTVPTPTGVPPVVFTVAVKVTDWPGFDGFGDEASVVVVPVKTLKLWVTWAAGLNVALPPWLAVTVQVPGAMKVITAELVPLPVQTDVVELASVTGRPELAVAVAVYVPPTSALVGAVDVKVIVWFCLLTVKLWMTCGAGLKVAFPAWSAVSVQVPAAMKLIVAEPVPLPVHTDGVELAIATPRPEVAVAVAV